MGEHHTTPTGDEPSLGEAHSTDDQHLEPGLGGEAALTHLIDAVHDQDPKIQHRAFEQLAAIGSERAIDILERAANDPNTSVRERAIGALGRIQRRRAVDILIDKLHTESKDKVRAHVILALGTTGSQRAVDLLIRHLQSDADHWERHYAALALAQFGTPQAVAALTQALQDTYAVRPAAGQAIRQIGEKHPDAVQPAIDRLLDDLFGPRDSERRYRAVAALGDIRPAGAVPRLIEAMKDPERPPHQRLAALSALRAIGDKRAAAPLLELFATTQHGQLRYRAAQALIVIREREAIPVLIDLLKHETWQVRWYAARILGHRDVRSAVPYLIPLLEDSRAQVRQEVANALRRIHQARHISQAIEPLTRALSDRVPMVGAAASRALDRIRQRDREHARAVLQAQENLNAD
jgi:HEAT repeat protein